VALSASDAREIALAVGREAAALLAPAQVSVASVRRKGGLRTDWVTEWDERAEKLIVDGLRARDPGAYILGEEGGASGEARGARWLVDPVDGTVNFAHGLPVYGVSIGYEVGGRMLAGVVMAPSLGWEFAAARGQGATMNGQAMRVSDVAALPDAMLATGFPADRATSPRNNVREFEHFQRIGCAVRRLGAASLDLCMVARGWLDGYWEFKLKPWDMAAGSIIVEEAGGRVTAPDGGPFVVDDGECIASNGLVHDAIARELQPFLPKAGG
jgi:myo-inositol-1(or 4)-monophosphatase